MHGAQIVTIDYRPGDVGYLADPFALYRRMQDEDPAHWSPRLKSWVLTRYDDIKRVCLDKQMPSDRLRPFFASMPGPQATQIRIGESIPPLFARRADDSGLPLITCPRALRPVHIGPAPNQ